MTKGDSQVDRFRLVQSSNLYFAPMLRLLLYQTNILIDDSCKRLERWVGCIAILQQSQFMPQRRDREVLWMFARDRLGPFVE